MTNFSVAFQMVHTMTNFKTEGTKIIFPFIMSFPAIDGPV